MRVLALAEVGAGGLRRESLEGLTAARAIAQGDIVAGIVGDESGAAAAAVARVAGVGKVLQAIVGRPAGYNPEVSTAAAVALAEASAADVIVIPGTTAGRDYAPRLAARMAARAAADVVAIRGSDTGLVADRPVFGGKMLSSVTIDPAVHTVLTVRPGAFAPAEADAEAVPIESIEVPLGPLADRVRTAPLDAAAGGERSSRLESAEIIVTGGRGLKEPENFTLIEDLARALGGAVGASRAVVDAGWRPHHEQVGQTGRSVSPRLYVAVGVSGAVQHLVGMQGSEVIVAINRDPDAPIFKVASFGIVGDLFDVVPAVVAELERARA